MHSRIERFDVVKIKAVSYDGSGGGGTAKLCRSKINVPAQNSRVGTTFDKTLVMVTLQKIKNLNAIHTKNAGHHR